MQHMYCHQWYASVGWCRYRAEGSCVGRGTRACRPGGRGTDAVAAVRDSAVPTGTRPKIILCDNIMDNVQYLNGANAQSSLLYLFRLYGSTADRKTLKIEGCAAKYNGEYW